MAGAGDRLPEEVAMARERPHLIVAADADALAKMAAERVVARINHASGRVAICLAGGSTPERLFRLMTTNPYRGAVPWQQVHWFWGDDRFVSQNDPRSNAGTARRLLLDHVPTPPGNVHPIPTTAGNVNEAADLYEAELRRFYGAGRLDPGRPLFEMVLMGLGADGHTASLFPAHPELEESERWVVGVAEPGLEPFVPRVTLTFPALASTREMLFLVSGRGKREILERILSGADLPAARARSEGEFVWLVDREALPENRDVA
jgi:6-phosphogluconolactonase